MLYYQVKKQYDNASIFHNGKHIITVIENELFTEKEKNNYFIPDKIVNPVIVNKNNTYKIFGVRKQCNN